MVRTAWASPATVRRLACPYCGHRMPLDEPGMVAAQAAWGFCGAVATGEDGVLGVLLLAPPTDETLSGPVRVSAARVRDDACGHGVGRSLVRTVADGLVGARAGALVATVEPPRGCGTLPAGFLRATGFVPVEWPLWRLDLATAVRPAKHPVISTLERLVQAVRPVAPPEPARRSAS